MNDDVLSMLGNKEPQIEEKKTQAADSEKIDDELFASMLTADGKDGNFSSDKKPDISEEDKPSVEIKPGKVKERLGKYADEFVENVKKHPDKYFVETSRGTMSIQEAIMAGWDPESGEFDDANSLNTLKENELNKLSESDREAVEGLIDPANAGIAAADAEGFGLDPNSPMIAQPPSAMPQEAAPLEAMPTGEQQVDPNALAGLLGGNM